MKTRKKKALSYEEFVRSPQVQEFNELMRQYDESHLKSASIPNVNEEYYDTFSDFMKKYDEVILQLYKFYTGEAFDAN